MALPFVLLALAIRALRLAHQPHPAAVAARGRVVRENRFVTHTKTQATKTQTNAFVASCENFLTHTKTQRRR